MGCRLHWAKQYKVEYTGGWFNYNAEVFRAIMKHLDIYIWDCQSSDLDDYVDFELSVDNFRKLKSIVKDARNTDAYQKPILNPDEASEYGILPQDNQYIMTYEDMDKFVQEVEKSYDRDNSFIRFTWF